MAGTVLLLKHLLELAIFLNSMNGGIDFPPKKNLKAIDEDPKNVASGIVSIEKEGDDSSGGSLLGVSEEAVAERLKQLDVILGELPSETANESSEISMEEVLHSYKKTADERASGADASPAKTLKPSKFNMKERTRGEKKAEATRLAATVAYEGDPHYGVPAVTDGVSETRKERQEALRIAVLGKQAELDAVKSKKVIALPDQSEEHFPTPVLGFKEIAKSADTQIERSEMESKEQAYLEAYKDLEQKKTIWNRLSKGKELKGDEKKVEALKNEFNQARIAYAAAIEKGIRDPGIQNMSEAFVSRMTERYQKLIAAGTPPLDGFGSPRTLREYLVSEEVGRREKINSYVTFREVLRPHAEKKLEARVKALDARGQGAFTKGLAWIGAQNQKLDGAIGKTAARAVRAAASTLVVAGGAAALGSFGTMGLLAVAGWGSLKFARAFGGAVIAAAAGEAGALAYEKLRGRSEQERARVGVLHEGKEIGVGFFGKSYITEGYLEHLDEKRDRLASRADESTLQKKKVLVKALVAMGVGAGAAATLAEYTSLQHAADTVAEVASENTPEPVRAATPGLGETVSPQVSSLETAPSGSVEAAPAAEVPYTTPEAPEGAILHEARIGKGEGFNQLIVDLRTSGFTGFGSELSATKLSEKIGAFDSETGKSGVMLEGDTLSVDAKGNVWFERNGETQLLMENKSGELIPHKLEGIEMRTTSTSNIPASEADTQSQIASPEIIETPASIQNEVPDVTVGPDTESIHSENPESIETGQNELVSEGFLPRANLDNGSRLEEMPPASLRTSPLNEFVPDHQDEGLLETGGSSEVFTNAHGVEINDSVPSTYEWKVPGMYRTLTVSSGGSPEERSAFARAYVNEHPGTTVHFITPVFNDGVMRFRLDAWDSVEGGPAQRLNDIAVREAPGTPVQSFSRIDPRDFIRKLP